LPPKIEVSVPAGSLIRPAGSDLGLPAARRQFCLATTKRVGDIRSLNWITVFFHPPFISKN